MQRATNFHIRIPHRMVVELLAPQDGKEPLLYQLQEINGAELMCKEYGHDNDVDEHDAECWNGIYPDDYETMEHDLNDMYITGYKNFELCVRDRENAMFPYWFVEMLNRHEHDITEICDIDIRSVSQDFLNTIAPHAMYKDMSGDLTEDLYSETLFREGEDACIEAFQHADDKVLYLAQEISEYMAAKGCAYVRFIQV